MSSPSSDAKLIALDRTDSNIVEFPGTEPPLDGYSESHMEKLHAKAFRYLEGEVCDLDRMGIAQGLIMECSAKEDSCHELELAVFAVEQMAKMTKEFRAIYYAAWHGEWKGAL